MNHTLTIPRRNTAWLKRLARWIGKQRRQLSNYLFYLRLNHTHREAWNKAEKTL